MEGQLARAFPEAEDAWIRETTRSCFEHVGREAVALASFVHRGLPAVRESVEWIGGLSDLRDAVDAGRGVVVVSGHFGNWEIAAAALTARGIPVDAVVQRLANPYLSRYVTAVRERLGLGLIDRSSAWDRLRASLQEGRVVAFAADQDARERGVFVPFFGRPASTHRAPALLALRSGVPLFVGGALRVGPRKYGAWVVRIDPPAAGDLRSRVLALTRDWTRELERRIRLSPDQYFWHHRRWKTQPRGTRWAGAGIRDGNENV